MSVCVILSLCYVFEEIHRNVGFVDFLVHFLVTHPSQRGTSPTQSNNRTQRDTHRHTYINHTQNHRDTHTTTYTNTQIHTHTHTNRHTFKYISVTY